MFSKLVEALKVIPGNFVGPDDFNQGAVSASCLDEDMRPYPIGLMHSTREYTLEATVCVRFKCNSAQYDQALHHAKLELSHFIYGNLHQDLNRVMGLIYSGEREEAVEIIGNLLNDIRLKEAK